MEGPDTPVLSPVDGLGSFIELAENQFYTCFEVMFYIGCMSVVSRCQALLFQVVQCDESEVGPTQNGDDDTLDNLASIQETSMCAFFGEF